MQVSSRKAFSLLTAIVVLIVMATIGALVMGTAGKIVKTTTTQFQHEQALLYAKSYTEFAVMAIEAHARSTNCLEDIDGIIGSPGSGNGYRVRVRIAYIGSSAVVANCSGTRTLSNRVMTTQTPLTAIIDAYVDYKDPDNTAQWRTVHRRTVQKI